MPETRLSTTATARTGTLNRTSRRPPATTEPTPHRNRGESRWPMRTHQHRSADAGRRVHGHQERVDAVATVQHVADPGRRERIEHRAPEGHQPEHHEQHAGSSGPSAPAGGRRATGSRTPRAPPPAAPRSERPVDRASGPAGRRRPGRWPRPRPRRRRAPRWRRAPAPGAAPRAGRCGCSARSARWRTPARRPARGWGAASSPPAARTTTARTGRPPRRRPRPSRPSSSTSTARPSTVPAWSRFTTTRIRRRSHRSTSTPATEPSRIPGSSSATVMPAVATVEPVRT